MKKAATSCPVRRLWISSLTDDRYEEGFKAILSRSPITTACFEGRAVAGYRRLDSRNERHPPVHTQIRRPRASAFNRARADPTLALIVKRHHEIANFVPKDGWELHTRYREVDFTYTGDRFDSEAPEKKPCAA